MRLWRISIYNDLTGMGGEFSKGRWHTPAPGKRIVYLAEHPALALLETIVNLKGRPEDRAENYQLLRIEAPDDIAVEQIEEQSLPENWRETPTLTRSLGDAWLERQTSAFIAVPSAPGPESKNYLLNPNHPDSEKITVTWSRWLRYDRRFFRLSE